MSAARVPAPRPDARSFGLLSLTVAATLALHATHLPLWLSPPLALLLALRWLGYRRGRRFPALLRYALVLTLPLGVIATYGTLFGRLPGAALAVGLLVLKLTETETRRDVHIAVAFAAFTLMSALLFGQSLLQTLLVCAALGPALATLLALQPSAGATRAILKTAALRLAAALPVTLLAFVLVPRLASPLWGAPGMQQARTGISASMSPGAIGQLLVDDSPAFRVGFDGPIPPRAQRYFRAVVLWHFDGRTWTSGSAARHLPLEPLQALGPTQRYTISMEATRQTLLPALDMPLQAPAATRFTAARTLLADRPVDHGLRYTVSSATAYRLQPRLGAHERALGLQLPGDDDPRARALALRWRTRYGDNPVAIIDAALHRFHDDGYRYTLTPPPLGRQQVDDFLFDTRAGFCEHYASAFVFLMRAAGIPARVVAGYQGGYANRAADYLLVRQADAHAWAEVWLRGRGWVRVDPTAAVRPDRISLGAIAAAQGAGARWYQAAWLVGLRDRIDVLNRLWDQSVVGFNALRQRGLLTRFGVDPQRWQSVALALGGALAVALAFGLALALREPAGERDALGRAFDRLQRRLTRRDHPRQPGEAPAHYLTRVAADLPAEQAAALRALSAQFVRLRYASTQPAPRLAVRDWIRRAQELKP
ncbi:MAG: transglutaminase TgpA family protein [Metallibacterium scheffleri]